MYRGVTGLEFTDKGEKKHQNLGIKHGKNPNCYNWHSRSGTGGQSVVFKNIPYCYQAA